MTGDPTSHEPPGSANFSAILGALGFLAIAGAFIAGPLLASRPEPVAEECRPAPRETFQGPWRIRLQEGEELLEREEDPADLVERFTRAIEKDPSDPMVHLAFRSRGENRFFQGDHEGALEDIARAIELAPLYFRHYEQRGLIYAELGQPELAFADFDRALELYQPDHGREHPQLLMNRGRLRIRVGEHDAALDDFTRAIAAASTAFGRARAFRDRGRCHLALGNAQAASADLDKSLEWTNAMEDPGYWTGKLQEEIRAHIADTYRLHARARSALGDAQGAIEDYTTFLRYEPTWAKAYLERGLEHDRLGHVDDARSDYDQADRWAGDDAQLKTAIAKARAGLAGTR